MKKESILVLAMVVYLTLVGPARAQWAEQAKLTTSDATTRDFFGDSVSISGDYCIVGAKGDDDNGGDSGSVYIFRRDGTSWIEEAKLTASDGEAGDNFGKSVSISGEYAIIGAYKDDDNGTRSGSAYIFKRSDVPNDPNWYEQDKLTASDGVAYDYFGRSVSIGGNYAIVGADWNDGVAEKSGSAYIFKRSDVPNDPNWHQQTKLTASDGAEYDYFGQSVSISGGYAIVGSKYRNSAYIFKRDGTSWLQLNKLTNGGEFGCSVSISGDYVIVGADEDWDVNNGPYSGSAYIFKQDDTTWIEQVRLTASDGVPDDYFGSSVSINGDYAIIGAYGDKAYIFKRDGTNWIQLAKLTASDDEAEVWDAFGESVSISSDYAIVGAAYDDDNGTDSGSAYVFTCEQPLVEAEIDINPHTLNLQSSGKWITCHIWLPEEYDVADVNSYSVFLEDEIGAEWIWADEEEQVVMAKFSRSALHEILVELETPTQVELLVTGELTDGTIFEGTDTIKVIDKGKKK